MPLVPGTRLGSYEVTALLGVGGMGEVYRATDSSLKRQVALKVLPASVSTGADRLARFQREAEVLAALNHPHIAAIYGLDRSGGQTALVMELVEGQTLADQIAQGAVAPADALAIATQIAEALEAANEQGIVHRDLKPANVKVRPDGTVKVLDFGLAKALEPAGAASSGQSMMATVTSPAMTQMGLILGTAAYMSPEQARGRPVDKRTDIWAFGCVLFEMLAGTRAFAGDDVAEVMGAVIHKDVDWTKLPPSTPPALSTVLKRCLERDPRQRIRDMGDVRLALTGAFSGLASADMSASRPAASRRTLIVASAAAAVFAATLGAAGAWVTRAPAPAETVAFTVDTPLTSNPGSFALSPDGRHLAFTAADKGVQMLWIRDIGATAAHVVAGTAGAVGPFWSPDSRRVGFFTANVLKQVSIAADNDDVWVIDPARGTTSRFTFGPLPDTDAVFSPDGTRVAFYSARTPPGIYLKPTSGAGSEELVAETGYQSWPRDWSSDGRFVLYQNLRDLFVLPMEGERKPFPFLATPAQETDGHFSPDTRWVAYASDESGRPEVYVQDFPAKRSKFLVSGAGGTEPRWRKDGRELFYLDLDGRLMSVSIDTAASVTLGVPQELFQTGLLGLPVPAQRRYEVSADGQQFLMNVPIAGAVSLPPITVVVNWQRALDGR